MPDDDLSGLLARAHLDNGGLVKLYEQIEPILRAMAHAQLRANRPDPQLDTDMLVAEAYLKLHGKAPPPGASPAWEDRSHFFHIAARAMHQVRIDAARRDKRRHHGPLESTMLDGVATAPDEGPEQEDWLAALRGELGELDGADPEAGQLFRLRFFDPAGGEVLSENKAAEQLGWSRHKVHAVWKRACRHFSARLAALGLERKESPDDA